MPGNQRFFLHHPHRLPHRDRQADAAVAAEAVVDFLEAVDEVADILAIGGAAGGGAEVGAAAEGALAEITRREITLVVIPARGRFCR